MTAYWAYYFYEDKQAFNIFRVNLISQDSGVSTRVYDEHGTPDDGSDDTIVSTTLKNTALGYIFSGSWAHCWLEGGVNTGTLVNNAFTTWVPDHQLVVILLNDPRYGGCGGGGFQIVPLGIGGRFSHMSSGMGLEHWRMSTARQGSDSGGEPGQVNITVNTNRNTLKWRNFVAPVTPVPTGVGFVRSIPRVLGLPIGTTRKAQELFEGGGTNGTGMYRPVINCRMRGNTPEYCPVCYTHMKQVNDSKTEHTFLNCYAGDFNGDGKDDVLIHNSNSVQIFRSNGTQLRHCFQRNGAGAWIVAIHSWRSVLHR